jgi:menaquinone-dependent protoporphyrinogen oxidase
VKTLVLYSSCDGQTLKIAKRIVSHLEDTGTITLADLSAKHQWPNPNDYQKVIIGASVRYGKLRPVLYEYIRQFQDALEAKPNAFFLICLSARKKEKSTPETNVYMKKFISRSPWDPKLQAVFAGALVYSKYNWWQTRIIQLIMKMTGGSTDSSQDIEFTVWDKVDQFAKKFIVLH